MYSPTSSELDASDDTTVFNPTAVGISSLPNELLARIFMHNVLLDFQDFSRSIACGALIVSAQVCRLWRGVALSSPGLWSYISSQRDWTSRAEWINAVLRRSKSAALNIEATVLDRLLTEDSLTAQYNLETVLRFHLSRIRCLRIDTQAQCMAAFLHSMSLTPALQLEELSIFVRTAEPVTLPADMFKQQSPRLRKLSLYDCTFSWGAHLLRNNLVSLSVSRWAASPAPIDEFMSVLQNLPLLEKLTLEEVIPILPNALTSANIINFPRLASIRLKGSHVVCTTLLKHLRFPQSCCYNYTLEGLQGLTLDVEDIFSVMRTKHRDDSLPIQQQHQHSLDITSSTSRLFVGFREVAHNNTTVDEGNSGRILLTYDEVEHPPVFNLLQGIMSVFQPVHITSLYVSWEDLDLEEVEFDPGAFINCDQWLSILDPLTDVAFLEIQFYSGMLFNATRARTAGIADPRNALPVLPKLRVVCYFMGKFQIRTEVPWQRDVGSPPPPSEFEYLMAWLLERQRICHPLKRFEIAKSLDITSEQVAAFQAVAPFLKYDGHPRLDEDED